MVEKLKKKISPNKAKFISSLVVGFAILILVIHLSEFVTNRTLKEAENKYFESCLNVVEGYSNAVKYYLENYHTSLSSIYNEELFKKGNMEEIQKWLSGNIKFVHEDFCATFYIDKNKIGYFSDGRIMDLKERLYIIQADFKNNYYISNLIYSDNIEYPIFVIEEPFFNESNEIEGALCAYINVEKLKKIAKEIKIGKSSDVCIVDKNGKFMVNKLDDFIGKSYAPSDENFSYISTAEVANNNNEIWETRNPSGEIIDLFTKKIENCEWTLGVEFPKSALTKIYRQQNSTKLIIFAISFLTLCILMLLEIVILNYCYKHQIIMPVFDPLTNLWTRERFEQKASRLIKHNPKTKFMLMEADIRGFKFVNQYYGTEGADKMLCFYGTLLSNFCAKHRGIIGRGYADHFYTLIKITDKDNALLDFQEEIKVFSKKIKDFELPFYPKFGITFLKPNKKYKMTIKELIGQASFAKSTIKDNILVPYSVYNSRLIEKINEEHYIESNMENALENGEFFVMYQPKILLADETIVGAEALVRWKTKDMGLLSPDSFIPLFERNGFITKLDFYVYKCVFEFLHRQISAGKKVVPVSVNMSRNHNKAENFMHDFMELFGRYNIPPKFVQVEILERSGLNDGSLSEITERLHEAGFTVAMDDFGSGESSLNMLTKIPVDVLKFDRDFLRSSTNEDGKMDEKSAKFIQGLIDLSKNLDKETVFEGVETVEQRDFLKAASCDQVQGFFYSKPLSEEDFIKFIEEH